MIKFINQECGIWHCFRELTSHIVSAVGLCYIVFLFCTVCWHLLYSNLVCLSTYNYNMYIQVSFFLFKIKGFSSITQWYFTCAFMTKRMYVFLWQNIKKRPEWKNNTSSLSFKARQGSCFISVGIQTNGNQGNRLGYTRHLRTKQDLQ